MKINIASEEYYEDKSYDKGVYLNVKSIIKNKNNDKNQSNQHKKHSNFKDLKINISEKNFEEIDRQLIMEIFKFIKDCCILKIDENIGNNYKNKFFEINKNNKLYELSLTKNENYLLNKPLNDKKDKISGHDNKAGNKSINNIKNYKNKNEYEKSSVSICSKNYLENKLELNVLYYDESLKDKKENNDNCSFLQMNIKGTFYGCHNLELYKNVIDCIKKRDKKFILISSGSSIEKIFNYSKGINQIIEWYIYCFNKEKYIHLIKGNTKIKNVFNNFDELKKNLYHIKIKNENIKSSNLIYLEDYNNKYIKLHYEIIRKYTLYKLLICKYE